MGEVDSEQIKITDMGSDELLKFMKDNGLSLSVSELEKLPKVIGRNPTITELHIFNTQWSEHTSYKSSRSILKQLPTSGKNVILGPSEDAGVAAFTEHKGEKYGIVMSHESHNHPSQVVPYEGAATGIGGNVRDVLCMGARVIACADPLRFGNPKGEQKNKVKYIANQVIEGIAGYGNPLGVPVIAGDVYFNESFDDNCLVNVVTLGVIKEKDIIHSRAPKNAVGHDIIIVGKATDNSGFGGAAFSSLILDEEDKDSNRGAVQVPDPFLKNVLIRATETVFDVVRKLDVDVGFKDMGAGGIMCATTELVSSAGYGAQIDLDKVHVSMHDLPPYMVACSETQERFIWICPPAFTDTILRIYNEDYDLSNVSEGAKAAVIGKVTKEQDYVLRHKGKIICNANVDTITQGILYEREEKQAPKRLKDPILSEPANYKQAVLDVLKHPNVASKARAYKHYDTSVQGLTVIGPGQADAGVQTPLIDCKSAIALSVDSNPRYARISAYHGAVNAVAESMRNVAAVGATPIALTDCLCYGNPEKAEQFFEFKEGVRGLADASKNLHTKGSSDPVPFVGGNVSFYNENAQGKSVDPSAIVACLGIIDDVSTAITMQIKKEGSTLLLIGDRKSEMGGSVYFELQGELGSDVPQIDFEKERNAIYAVTDAIAKRLVLSCHDISDGGLAATVSEMILGGEADGKIGATLNLDFSKLLLWKSLFSETSGFVLEISNDHLDAFMELCKNYGIDPIALGKTGGSKLIITKKMQTIDISIKELKEAWTSGFVEALE